MFVAARHSLAKKKKISVQELCKYSYIRISYADDYYLSEVFHMARGVPESKYAIDNDYAALAMAEHGLGYCIFPEMIVQNTLFELKHLELDPSFTMPIHIGIRLQTTCSRATKAFMEHVIEWVNGEADMICEQKNV